MRAKDILTDLQTFVARVRLPQTGYNSIVHTTVQARTAEQARRLLRAQFGGRNAVIGQPRRLRRGAA